MQFGSGFGLSGFGGRFDENLASKVEQVVGKQTKEQRLAAQLREMGIDPDALPFKPEDAMRHIRQFMNTFSDWENDKVNTVQAVEFVGSSLGFSRVLLHGEGYDYDEYDDEDGEYKKVTEEVSVTKDSELPEGTTWRDLEKSWEALRPEHSTRFRLSAEYNATPERVEQKFHKTPKRLRTGQTARIEKGEEHQYVRMGGLWGDDMLTNLQTMQPITDTTGWTVVEVIEE